MNEKIVLSKVVEVQINNKVYKVGSLSMAKLIEISPKIDKLAKVREIDKQVELFTEILYDILSEYNEGITKDQIKKEITVEAGIKILQMATGQNLLSNLTPNLEIK